MRMGPLIFSQGFPGFDTDPKLQQLVTEAHEFRS